MHLGFNEVQALFTDVRASLLTVASQAGAWVAVRREWMALAGRQVAAKRRRGAAKRRADGAKRLGAARSVVRVATLGLAAGLLPEAIPATAA